MSNSSSDRYFNLFGPKFRSNPYPTYAKMRTVSPVYRRSRKNGTGGVCFITRYEDVAAILRDSEHFVKDIRNTMTPAERAELPPRPKLMRLLGNHMLNLDAPDHTRLRALVNKAFTTRMVEKLRVRMEIIAEELLAEVKPRGQMDLIAEYALPFTVIVIAEMLGIPTHDHSRFKAWSNALVSPSANRQKDRQKLARSKRMMQDFIDYLGEIFAERRRTPQDDLITSLLQAEEAGDVLSEDELYSMILLLVVVGHETSVNLIGNGCLTLLHHRDEIHHLRTHPAQFPSAVEEILRYDCPVERAPMRFAAEEMTMHGVVIQRGDSVSVVLGSANRDPQVFEEPNLFDIGRARNRHLAFGLGSHYCLGASLARLEGEIGLHVLLRRLPNLRLAAPLPHLKWGSNPIMRGLRSLPVIWDV